MKITAIIERNGSNYYQISSEDKLGNCFLAGYGYSVEEAKQDFMVCIEESKEIMQEQGLYAEENVEVIFRYDIPSFFNYFDWINVSQFAKRVGINESKMRQYKSGVATASEATTRKILDAVHEIGAEMQRSFL